MTYEEQKLSSKIYFLEDTLLRSKNQYEIEVLRRDIMDHRKLLQKMKWKNTR